MSAERLREAAKVLREKAGLEPAWPCQSYISRGIRHLVRNCETECSHNEWSEPEQRWIEHDCPAPYGTWDRLTTADYIATMHPGVGLALADWLDASADFHEDKPHGYDCLGCGAESVADAILGGVS